jgi:arginine exporter protein ArgO
MTAHDSAATRGRTTRTPVQLAALVVGAVFLLVGILGFIPGITTNYDHLTIAGHHSSAMLLGLFAVSVLHNIVHLLFGVAGIALARRFDTARLYLIVGGVVYAVLWLYGLIIDRDSSANFVPVNNADNWLHLVLAIGMIALGVLLGRRAVHAGATGAAGPAGGAQPRR